VCQALRLILLLCGLVCRLNLYAYAYDICLPICIAIREQGMLLWLHNAHHLVNGSHIKFVILYSVVVTLYTSLYRPMVMHGEEAWTVTRRMEGLLERTEMRMLRWIL